MQLHQIKPTTKRKKDKRVGRGGKKGTFSGKGVKGQKSRAGRKLVPSIRGIIKKYHKLKGYRVNAIDKGIAVVNLNLINNKYAANEIVSPETLLEKGLIRKEAGKLPVVKILSDGEISKPLVFKGCQYSKTTEEKIKKSEGKI
ncbi:MAG: uL15 family ribosomal protein [Candidatus Nealsonbacteria bacterium]|nr:uL15 family ribosomal protein [Candidatus Nealsonbacteria bacterium]